jgi:ABC-type dipeptide/oligopeptide/nickel transport system ATPase subunit
MDNMVETQNVRAVKNAVKYTVTHNDILAVIAEVGSGKTELFNCLADHWMQHPNKFTVTAIKAFKQRLSRIPAIMSLIIETVDPGVYIPQTVECRYRVFRDTLRLHSKSRHIILMIDEAQDLSFKTFYELKKIHEVDSSSRKHLFSIIMFGKPNKKWDKLFSTPEVGYRAHCLLLEKLNSVELVEIAEKRYNILFENKTTRDRFAASLQFKTPLGVEHFSRAIRHELRIENEEPVTINNELLFRVPMLSLKMRARQAGIKQLDIVRVARDMVSRRSVNTQRVSEFFSNKLSDEKLKNELEAIIEAMISEKHKKISGL